MTSSVAMAAAVADCLRQHLCRNDGQEDVCLALYRPSTGRRRRTWLLHQVMLPLRDEREVHGNASFTGDYVLRVAAEAMASSSGVAVLHSHPGAHGWQAMSGYDADAERSFAYLVNEITGMPLVGLTLAGGDNTWSARTWSAAGDPEACENVRVVGDVLHVSWNDHERPPPQKCREHLRTVNAWGDRLQADIARIRVLVVGAGSVGLEVALRLVASGIENVGVMDFDEVEQVNLDRLIGARRLDALLHRRKIDVARRLLGDATTAARPDLKTYDLSICENEGLLVALDYDVVISCVDRPWPRAVMNMLAYADLIPVIDGGIHIDAFPDGGMRNATWRSHVVRPGRPCLACNRQLDLGEVAADREGLLDDPAYIRGSGRGARSPQNVATLSVSVVGGLLAQFVSMVAAPGGAGDPGPLQYLLSTHSLEHLPAHTEPCCRFERSVALGDDRVPLTGRHRVAELARARRDTAQRRLVVRAFDLVDRLSGGLSRNLTQVAAALLRG